MRKKQLKILARCTGRGGVLAAFSLALIMVLSPAEAQSVAAGSQTLLAMEAAEQATAELPEIGDRLIPLGKTTGIKLFCEGPMVVGFAQLESCSRCPAKEGGLQVGDVLLKLNGQQIGSNEAMKAMLAALPDEQAVFTVLRKDQEQLVTVNAVYDPALECWRIGAWIRDSVAGIGTVTFVDPETGVFGALGHGICDADTGDLVHFGSGSVMPSSVVDVQKSKSGTPGQLCGQFDLIHDQGWLVDNDATGIYGVLTHEEFYAGQQAVETAAAEEIHEGAATILSCVQGDTAQEYDVQITRIYRDDGGRDMMLQVTDPDLLAVTGGIVQGMSGSPIIQDGKLVGAVTHVLVNDPTRGYGIFIENMLKAVE